MLRTLASRPLIRHLTAAVALLLASQFGLAPASSPAQAASTAGGSGASTNWDDTVAAGGGGLAATRTAAQLPLPGLQAPAAPAALPSNPVDYAYDGAGQLRGITQAASGGNSAQYDYDASGNLLNVTRSASNALTLISLTPSRAPVGASVTINGTGFAATTAGNTVKFDGTTATVTQASTVRLVVTVPSGATTGTVTVTTSAGTASSGQTFTVAAATPVPTVAGVSPTSAAAGASVTITGTGFATTPTDNTVSFARTRARVTAATANSLTVTVPDGAGSGRITVATAGGSATSDSDFVAVPRTYAAGDVATTSMLAIDGTASTVTIGTSGKVALLRFAGTKGQRLSLGLTGSTFTTDVEILGFGPYGATFARDQFEGPFLLSALYGGFALPVLPTSGIYQIVLDPLTTGTGAVTATLSSRVTGALSLTGAGTQVNLTRAGQQTELTFDATAGQQISLGFTGSTFTASRVTAEVKEPNGTPLLWSTNGAVRTLQNIQGDDLDLQITQTGTYRLLFGPENAGTGSIMVTASTVLDAGAITAGTPKAVTLSRPGQDARMTFAGTAGQRLILDFTSYTFAYSPYLEVTKPDGTVLSSATPSNLRLDLADLPVTGTYAIRVSPFSSTGSFTARLIQRQDAGVITSTGASVPVSLSQPGTGVDLTFSGTAGQRLSFAFTGWTFAGTALVRAQVLDSAGTVVAVYRIWSLSTFWFTVNTTGNHRLVLAPEDSSTGAATVTLAEEIAGGALTIGTAKTVSSPRIGQTTKVTFTLALVFALAWALGHG